MAAYVASSKARKALDKGTGYLHSFLFYAWNTYLDPWRWPRITQEFNYHPRCGKLKITHLAFADDLMLMARGDATQ